MSGGRHDRCGPRGRRLWSSTAQDLSMLTACSSAAAPVDVAACDSDTVHDTRRARSLHRITCGFTVVTDVRPPQKPRRIASAARGGRSGRACRKRATRGRWVRPSVESGPALLRRRQAAVVWHFGRSRVQCGTSWARSLRFVGLRRRAGTGGVVGPYVFCFGEPHPAVPGLAGGARRGRVPG